MSNSNLGIGWEVGDLSGNVSDSHGCPPENPPTTAASAQGFSQNGQTEPVNAYLGRSEYLDEELAKKYEAKNCTVSEADMKTLYIHQAFDLPSRSIRSSLIDSFMITCSPWMPIVDRDSLEETSECSPSILLLQAIFLAGNRVRSAPLSYASSEDLYRRAKALLLCGYEKDTMTVIKAICLMQWWNPTGPEHISLDKSSFWLRTGVGVAFEIGLHREPGPGKDRSLRRRLWWTLFTRDCVISAGSGRPRTINMEDCSVRPVSLDDFAVPDKNAELFVAYVGICSILGDLTECCIRNQLSHSKRVLIETELYRWISCLPSSLQMYRQEGPKIPAPYDSHVWQLHIIYFTILTILYRPTSITRTAGPISLLSSSFVAGIFEDFLVRDDIRFLGPIFSFHLLIAVMPQLSCHSYPTLRSAAEDELRIIKMSLHELGKRWPSAIGPQKVIDSLTDRLASDPPALNLPNVYISHDQLIPFSKYGPHYCRKWDLIFKNSDERIREVERANPDSFRYAAAATAGEGSSDNGATVRAAKDPSEAIMRDNGQEQAVFDFRWEDDALYEADNFLDPVPDWVLQDWRGLDGTN
ncbi:Cutinase transcription factor 1 alpha [Hyphodiscus hymeniophilus]|uniref:Cutinase transcription factor 1 alpha n=1 Tax=Hyphodiscus hymeniophilus TaxID=353542 RepID=A0A9P7AYG6_9HELO|nr:Cutinase transcription factor 1 alpha [Hyphodiscus hymeniophilus]